MRHSLDTVVHHASLYTEFMHAHAFIHVRFYNNKNVYILRKIWLFCSAMGKVQAQFSGSLVLYGDNSTRGGRNIGVVSFTPSLFFYNMVWLVYIRMGSLGDGIGSIQINRYDIWIISNLLCD